MVEIGRVGVKAGRPKCKREWVAEDHFGSSANLFASVVGMSFGGRVSGVIFDLTGSYAAAFANGFAWNLLSIAIVLMLLMRGGRWRRS
jgi:hypothetical protein